MPRRDSRLHPGFGVRIPAGHNDCHVHGHGFGRRDRFVQAAYRQAGRGQRLECSCHLLNLTPFSRRSPRSGAAGAERKRARSPVLRLALVGSDARFRRLVVGGLRAPEVRILDPQNVLGRRGAAVLIAAQLKDPSVTDGMTLPDRAPMQPPEHPARAPQTAAPVAVAPRNPAAEGS